MVPTGSKGDDMTIKQAIETVRVALGDRNEHHPECSSIKTGHPCDCYAARRQLPHKCMDMIEEALRKAVPHDP